MDKIKKFDLMDKIVNELEDLKNNLEAIVRKLGQIEVDNIELGNKSLERILPDMHQRVSDNLDSISEIFEDFGKKRDEFSAKNNIDQLKEQDAINNL